jgi:hypothetical protein
VFGSEALDYVVDEGVQIHGGMGYSAEMLVERAYRDSRINRIFEGTNEINRLITVDSTMKKGLKHKIDLFEAARDVLDNIDNIASVDMSEGDYYEAKHAYVKNLKKAVLLLLPAVQETFKRKLMFEEEILMNISDMIMNIYILESTLLRVEKMDKNGLKTDISIYQSMLNVLTQDIAGSIYKSGFDAIGSFAEGDQKARLCNALGTLTKAYSINVKEERRKIADKVIDEGRYIF